MSKPSRILKALSRRIQRARLRGVSGRRQHDTGSTSTKDTIAFLHIGKNAGTQFKRVADQVNAGSTSVQIVKLPHNRHLRSLPAEQRYIFSIRSPHSRFYSGFYSRKRKGAPKYYSEWSAHEAKAFECFEHANDLAEALFEDGQRGLNAFSAIKSITHCSMDQIGWFDREGAFLQIRPPITIIRQEEFEKDVARFLRLIGFDQPVQLTDDATLAHRNDYADTPPLSEKARANLSRWYAQDIEFYRLCEFWLSQKDH